MQEFLTDRYGALTSIIDGTEDVKEPKMCNFINTAKACKMLNRHLENKSIIAVHCDVDVDGIGSGYIMRTMLEKLGAMSHTGFLINPIKEHGIKQKHCDYFRSNKIGLLIVLDSSSNDLEFIRQMNCDVLVIDHHDLLHKELAGKTEGGEYVIVSNMIDNDNVLELKEAFENELQKRNIYVEVNITPYKADSNMSCGLVLYEFLRVYQSLYETGNIIQDNMLYQWVGVTLLTDAIPLHTERNQYYIENTVNSSGFEQCLNRIIQRVASYRPRLDKTVINYSIAPRINKAIRAGESSKALDIILNNPDRIMELDEYKARQEEVIKQALKMPLYGTGHPENKRFVFMDLSGTGIEKSYCGVIAMKLVTLTGLNSAVGIYNPQLGVYEGSFRGRKSECNYREYFENDLSSDDGSVYAQGHAAAFGFKATGEQINVIMQGINSVEPEVGSNRYYLTAGDILDCEKGIHHIEDMLQFKREQGLVRLSIANSKLSTEEEINIMVKRPVDLEIKWYNELKKTAGTCEIMGIQCKVFEELKTDWIQVYVEYSKEITAYARNMQA